MLVLQQLLFWYQINYTKNDVTRLVSESSKHLKNHLMKTVYINKLQPEYKEYILYKEPANLQEANNLAVALWRRKNPEDIPLNQNQSLPSKQSSVLSKMTR